MQHHRVALGQPEWMRVAVGTEPTGFGGSVCPELWTGKAGPKYLPLRGGGWPVDHLEEVLQQLFIPVQVTELLRYGATESGKGEVFQGVNILPWFAKDGSGYIGRLSGSLALGHWEVVLGLWGRKGTGSKDLFLHDISWKLPLFVLTDLSRTDVWSPESLSY